VFNSRLTGGTHRDSKRSTRGRKAALAPPRRCIPFSKA
jgi:hypothetical protein